MLQPQSTPPITLDSLKDQLISLSYRLNEAQSTLARKMDRNECMGLLQRKINKEHIKQLANDIEQRWKREEAIRAKLENEATNKINDLTKELARKLKSPPPQQSVQLFPSQTIISLLVEELSTLKQSQINLQKSFQQRGKKMISLNNEVFKKLQKLQSEIQQKINGLRQRQRQMMSTWTYQRKSPTNSSKNPNKTISKMTSPKKVEAGEQFDTIRCDILSKTIQSIQKDLLQKLNIKDLLPLIKQSTGPLSQEMVCLKQYVQESIESTRKILTHQSQINQELCGAQKIGWWSSASYSVKDGLRVFGKEHINLLPQVYQLNEQQSSLSIGQSGLYKLKINTIGINEQEEQEGYEVMVGIQILQIHDELIMRMEKGCEIKVRDKTGQREILLFMQKI